MLSQVVHPAAEANPATRITPDLISLPPTEPIDISAWNEHLLTE